MADSEASKVCLVSFGASNRKISWNIRSPDATLSDYDNIKIEFKKVFHDLVTAEEKLVFQKWDEDFEEWVDINPLDSIENKSKLKAVCVRNEQRSSSKSDESEVKHTMKETGQATLLFSKQRTIGQNGKLGPCVPIKSAEEEAKSHNVTEIPVNVERLREESKLFGKKATSEDGLSEWQKKMNEAAFAFCVGTPSLTLNRGELLEKAREKVDNDGFNYKKGKSRSKKFGAASTGDSKVKRPKLESGERRSLIEETKESIKEQSEKLAMLEREKCKLVNMNQFGAASHILDRISSARKEKRQLAKKLAALEQKESKAVKRKLALQAAGGNKTAKKADEGHAAEKNDNSIEKYLKPKDTQENNENAIGEETEKQNETAVQEEKEKKDHFL